MTGKVIGANICTMEHIADEPLKRGAGVLQALSEPNRLRIVRLLLVGGESCVCELMDALRLPQYTVSRHLAILRHAGVVDERREGTWRYYSVISKPDRFVGGLLAAVESGLREELLETDLISFKRRLALRVDGKCVVGTDGQGCCSDDKSN
ncbi:MAG: metalloregulator ArsR/SmtB family transcription factor [Actinobacteria bacterium]|nr:metalloregulator ArsR/SmtB family transcription factor [Actinomycetota bacterium]